MAQSFSNLHPVNEILSQYASEAASQLDSQLIHQDLFETVKVPKNMRSGTILIENNNQYMGTGLDLKRAAGSSRARQSSFDFESTTYRTIMRGLEASIAFEDLDDNQYPIDLLQREIRKITRSLMIDREKEAASTLFGTSNWTGYNNTLADFNTAVNTDANGTKWDAAGAEPLTDLLALSDTIRKNAFGMSAEMQTLVMGYDCFLALQRNPELRGYLGSTANGLASGRRILPQAEVIDIIKGIFGFADVKVARARNNSANAGQTQTTADIWTANSLFLGVLKSPDGAVVGNSGSVKTSPASVLCLEVEGMKSGQYDSLDQVRRQVWVEHEYVNKVIKPSFGYLLTSVVDA
mgnify:FL=1